ncbi:hypothetical protein G6F59_017028 [Rhizopus arrhizus]|nr:hypothetical protein G6F59_017028 [Rhizopus arrhizus]
MLREAHAHAAAMVQRHPRRAAGGIEQGVQQRPVGHCVGAVGHRLGFAVRRCHAAAVQVVTADHHWRLQFTIGDHFVEGQAEAITVAQADPADARRQALELDLLGGHVQPAMQVRVVRNQFLHLGIGLGDVFRTSGRI